MSEKQWVKKYESHLDDLMHDHYMSPSRQELRFEDKTPAKERMKSGAGQTESPAKSVSKFSVGRKGAKKIKRKTTLLTGGGGKNTPSLIRSIVNHITGNPLE